MFIRLEILIILPFLCKILSNNSLDCEINIKNDKEIILKKCNSTNNFEDIDNFIYINKTISNLSIIESKLNKFPLFICNLTRLIHLNLSFNSIVDIPEGCLKNKNQLVYLNLDNNYISEIRDGTFDGMKNLKKLSCSNNKIKYIGSKVFSNVTDLSQLVEIDLNSNQLTSLDVWPIIRAVYVHNSIINLSNNLIANLTNYLKWKYICNLQKNIIHAIFRLDNNKMTNYNGFINTYFNSVKNLLCFSSLISNESSSGIHLYLEGNPFYCDCFDFPILKFIQIWTKIKFLDKVYCSGPENLNGKTIVSLNLNELICIVPTELQCPAKCECKKQPSNGTFHVLCSSKQLTILPPILPSTKTPTKTFAKYKLVFKNNSIEYMAPMEYFNETIWLDISDAKIKNLNKETWMSIKNIKRIYLHNNKITILPKIILEEPGKFEQLSIYKNPIACDCENIWFKEWLINKGDKIDRLESIICETPNWLKGKSIIHINDEEFCTDPYLQNSKKTTYIIIFVIVAILILIIILFAIVYYNRVQVNAILNIHPFDRDECIGEEMLYDVFISCSYQDRILAIELVKLFESRGYVVCYHEKDFVGGHSITDNINTAISMSRRIICLISEAFLSSPTCIYEFDMALHRNIEIKRNRLILMLLQSLKLILAKQLSPSLEQFIKSHTYLEYESSKHAKNKSLLYAMPIKPLKQLNQSELLPILNSA